MPRRLLGLAAASAVVVLAAACDQAPPSAPLTDGPSFKPVSTSFLCNFTGNPSLSNSINAYFDVSSDKNTASGYASAMQSALSTGDSATAQQNGFNLLNLAPFYQQAITGVVLLIAVAVDGLRHNVRGAAAA